MALIIRSFILAATVLSPGGAAMRAGQPVAAVLDNFERHADGPPARTLNGAEYYLRGTHASTVTVKNGRLIAVAPEDRVATYVQTRLQHPGTLIGARMAFSPFSTRGGAATIGFWSAPMDNDTHTLPENSPAHFVLSPSSWNFSVWSGGVETKVAGGIWLWPLVADGVSQYRVKLILNREASSAIIIVADERGTVRLRRRLVNPLIGRIPGNYAFIEHYRAAKTDTLPLYTQWWAGSSVRRR